ncbi:MAG TPA: YhjD/YihY/BrkB family envelope integrity protein [Candidatus Binataceae bacterium]|nr:YhjD/YihY/BrkB family envelope integrity protein [Candidatus Binataceae bacterium]
MAAKIRQPLRDGLSAEARRKYLARLNQLSDRGPGRILRVAYAGFNNHNDMLWASGLTYTTSLSLVPILAVGLAAVKGLGLSDRVKPVIQHLLAASSPEVADRLMNFVGNINANTLGAVGGASLLVTVVLTLGTIEKALNNIFNVARSRTWLRKFTDYLSLVFTLPLLLVGAAPIKNSLQTALPHLRIVGWIVATVPVWAGFTFLYLFFPNTRVRWDRAAIGGLAAAILLEVGQWGYVRFEVGAARSQAIYGALAALPVFLTWIYLAWIIVLAGAEVTAAAQGTEPAFDLDYRSPRFTKIAALLTMARAAGRMSNRAGGSCAAQSLAAELGVPAIAMRPVLDTLEGAGLIHEVGAESGARAKDRGIFLSRDAAAISLAEVIDCFEQSAEAIEGDEQIGALLERLRLAQVQAVASMTVKDLVGGN